MGGRVPTQETLLGGNGTWYESSGLERNPAKIRGMDGGFMKKKKNKKGCSSWAAVGCRKVGGRQDLWV